MLIARYLLSALRYALITCPRFVDNAKKSAQRKNKSGTKAIALNNWAKRAGETTYKRASVAAISSEEIISVLRLISQVREADRAILLFWLCCRPCSCACCIV